MLPNNSCSNYQQVNPSTCSALPDIAPVISCRPWCLLLSDATLLFCFKWRMWLEIQKAPTLHMHFNISALHWYMHDKHMTTAQAGTRLPAVKSHGQDSPSLRRQAQNWDYVDWARLAKHGWIFFTCTTKKHGWQTFWSSAFGSFLTAQRENGTDTK